MNKSIIALQPTVLIWKTQNVNSLIQIHIPHGSHHWCTWRKTITMVYKISLHTLQLVWSVSPQPPFLPPPTCAPFLPLLPLGVVYSKSLIAESSVAGHTHQGCTRTGAGGSTKTSFSNPDRLQTFEKMIWRKKKTMKTETKQKKLNSAWKVSYLIMWWFGLFPLGPDWWLWGILLLSDSTVRDVRTVYTGTYNIYEEGVLEGTRYISTHSTLKREDEGVNGWVEQRRRERVEIGGRGGELREVERRK